MCGLERKVSRVQELAKYVYSLYVFVDIVILCFINSFLIKLINLRLANY